MTPVTEVNPPGLVLQFLVIKMLTWIRLPPALRYSCTVTSSRTWGGSRWHCTPEMTCKKGLLHHLASFPLPFSAVPCATTTKDFSSAPSDLLRTDLRISFQWVKYLNSIYLSICDNFCLFPACTSASSSSPWLAYDPVPRLLSAILCAHVKWY